MKTTDQHSEEFEKFMEDRLKTSTDFVEGNFEALKKISVEKPPATIFPPSGNCVQGVEEVNNFNKNGAATFLPGAENTFEVMHKDADEHLAYWTGIQRSVVKMKGKNEKVIFNLRVTEIFRKENHKWKLMHRHADQLKNE